MRYTFTVIVMVAVYAPLMADDAADLSTRIDDRLAAKWQGKVEPAPASDDAAFFRRLSLDLTGRIPSLAMVKDFLDDDRPDKRRRWADEFLDGTDHAERHTAHMATRWRAILLAQANPQLGIGGARLENWLTKQFRANAGYDKLVRALLTDPTAAEFYTAYEGKPENIAGATARALLGVRLECVQCHADRSGGAWTREQFWAYAAFFSRIGVPRIDGNRVQATDDPSDGPPRIKLPEKDTYISAKYLDGTALDWKAGNDPKVMLGEWITKPGNRWFARAAVNRVWQQFFGVGLIDPVDGLGSDAGASHTELLDDLTKAFVDHKHDLKFLMRAIVGTKAYQRTSRQTHPSHADPRAFARMPVRALSAEQLFDSVVEASGYAPPTENSADFLAGRATSPRATFLAKFQTHPDQPLDTATSIQQALFLMNGELATTAAGPGGKTLAAVSDGPGTTAEKVSDLFLVVLSRKPTAAEVKKLAAFVDAAADRKLALADVFWALLNSTEFAVNH